jgi:hypothetical protein
MGLQTKEVGAVHAPQEDTMNRRESLELLLNLKESEVIQYRYFSAREVECRCAVGHLMHAAMGMKSEKDLGDMNLNGCSINAIGQTHPQLLRRLQEATGLSYVELDHIQYLNDRSTLEAMHSYVSGLLADTP